MNKIGNAICLSFLVAHLACGQTYRTVTVFFKAGTYVAVTDTISKDILTTSSLTQTYGKKAPEAHVEYLAWSPDMRFIAVVVSQIRTGDYDDIWILSTKDSSANCLTNLFSVEISGRYGVPVWKSSDTLMFEAGAFVATVDVPGNRIVSQVRRLTSHNPSFVSLDGRLRYEYDGTGAALSVLGHDGKAIVTVGKGHTRTGSILGAAFSPNGRFLAVEQFLGHGESRILVADMQSRLFKILRLTFGSSTPIAGNSNWYPQKEILLVTDVNGRLHFLNMITQTDDFLDIPDYYIDGAAVSPDGARLALILQHKRTQTYAVRIITNPFRR